MKKLWFGLFAFVLSLCCGFALLHGSYTRSNLIAHSNAYVGASTYQLPDGATDINWSLVSDMYIPTYNNNTRPAYCDGYWYQFYAQNLENGSTFVITTTDASDGTQFTTTYTIASNPEDEFSFDLTSAECYVYDGYVYALSGDRIIKFALNTTNLSFNYPFYYQLEDSVTFVRLNNGFIVDDGEIIVFSNGTYSVINLSTTPVDVFVDTDSYTYEFSIYAELFLDGGFVIGDRYYVLSSYDFNDNLNYNHYEYSVLCYVDFTDGTYGYYLSNNVLAQDMSDTYTWSDGVNIYGASHSITPMDNYTEQSVSWVGYVGDINADNLFYIDEHIYMKVGNNIYVMNYNVPYISPYPNVLAEMIALITSGIAGIAEGIGANLSVLAESVMIDANTGNLSAFGSLVVIMAGLALALHLCRWVVNFVTSLGRRDR